MNIFPPHLMDPKERIREAVSILSLGILRLKERQKLKGKRVQCSKVLDFQGVKSANADDLTI